MDSSAACCAGLLDSLSLSSASAHSASSPPPLPNAAPASCGARLRSEPGVRALKATRATRAPCQGMSVLAGAQRASPLGVPLPSGAEGAKGRGCEGQRPRRPGASQHGQATSLTRRRAGRRASCPPADVGRGARAPVRLHANWKCTARRSGGGGQCTHRGGHAYGLRRRRTSQGTLVHDWPSWARRSRLVARTFPPAGSSVERLWIARSHAWCAPVREDLRR